MKRTTIDAGHGVYVAIENATTFDRLRFELLAAAWVLWSALPSSRPLSAPPRRPYRLIVHDQTGNGIYVEGGFRGGEAKDAAKQFASDIRRIGLEDWLFKKTHGLRID